MNIHLLTFMFSFFAIITDNVMERMVARKIKASVLSGLTSSDGLC